MRDAHSGACSVCVCACVCVCVCVCVCAVLSRSILSVSLRPHGL